jgi:hypothetical protein
MTTNTARVILLLLIGVILFTRLNAPAVPAEIGSTPRPLPPAGTATGQAQALEGETPAAVSLRRPDETAETARAWNFCWARVEYAAVAGRRAHLRVSGRANTLTLQTGSGIFTYATPDVCSGGSCAVDLATPGPYTVRFDGCEPVYLGG